MVPEPPDASPARPAALSYADRAKIAHAKEQERLEAIRTADQLLEALQPSQPIQPKPLVVASDWLCTGARARQGASC